MNRFPLAVTAILLLVSLASSCEKPGNSPVGPAPGPDEEDNSIVMTDATSLLYYGDRKTEGLYNYFVGFCDTMIIEDGDGYLIPSGDGHMVKVDFYSSVPSASWETAELPDGTYVLQGKDEELSAGMLDNYYTRIETVSEGAVKSTDFTSGTVEVSSKDASKIIKGTFVLADGSEFAFRYEGSLEPADPDASGILPPFTEPVDAKMNIAVGAYYGDDYNIGSDRYEMALANTPLNEDGDITGAGYVLFLSFFDEPSSFIGLSAGTYEVSDTYEAKTVEKGEVILDVTGSFIAKYDEHGDTEGFCLITGGSVKVALSGFTYSIDADLVADNGTSIKAAYTGEIDFEDNSSSDNGSLSTLTGDVDVTFSENTEVSVQYCGDWYGTGTDNWYIELYDEASYIIVDLNTPKAGFSEKIPFPQSGQYNMAVNYGVGMIPGMVVDGLDAGTWYFDVTTEFEDVLVCAAAIDGTIKYSKSGDQDVLNIDLVDENYNLVSAVWKGVLPAATDESSSYSSASARPASVKMSCVKAPRRIPAVRLPSSKAVSDKKISLKAASDKKINLKAIKADIA